MRRRQGVVTGGILILAAAGCQRLPAPAVQQIEQGHRAYQARDYNGAQRSLSQVIAAHAHQPDTAEALYIRGLCSLQTRRPADARRDFEVGLSLTDRPELRCLLHAQLGNMDYETGRYQQAANHYAAARFDLPDEPPTDRVLQRYSESLQRIGRFQEAKKVSADLVLRFPGSRASTQTRHSGTWASKSFSVQCGVYAQDGSAQSAARKLRDRGIDAGAWREQKNGTTRYVVRAGEYSDYASAQQALLRIRPVVPDAFIVP